MSTHDKRVVDRILPKSMANTFSEAVKEWCFTEEIEDHKKAKENCELSDQDQLRYHFLIKNSCTNHYLWVDSKSILKLQIQVFDNGQLLDEKQSASKLRNLTAKMKLDVCIAALKELVSSEDEDKHILPISLDFYLEHKYLTPRYAFVILWRLSKHKINCNPSFFKISLKQDSYKRELANMETFMIHIIWPALTASQKKLAISYGHTRPPKIGFTKAPAIRTEGVV